MRSLRTLQRALEVSNSKACDCKVEDCSEITKDGKDFCPDHVEFHPYVRDLLTRIKDRESEDEKVRRTGSGSVNMAGITVQEILLQLRQNGARTEERLTRDIQLDKVIIHSYLIRLSNEGVIKFIRTARNIMAVRMVKHDPSQMITEEKDK